MNVSPILSTTNHDLNLPMPRVGIVILNWNRRQETLDCLASLGRLEYPDYEIVVVDNGSEDGSAAAIAERQPAVTLIQAQSNLGFAVGNNLGLEYLRRTRAGYFLLLNNDTEVAPDFLLRLVQAAEADPRVGAVGPTIYYDDRPEMIWSAGGLIDWQRGLTEMVGLGQVDGGQFGMEPRPVDFVTGCALLARMSVLEQVGLLEPRFFAYYEEAEWCVRVTKSGFRVLHVPAAKIWHKIAIEEREASPPVHYYMTRNRLLFLRMTRAGWRAWLNTLLLDYGQRVISWTLRPRWRTKVPQRRAMLRGIVDYYRGQFGPARL